MIVYYEECLRRFQRRLKWRKLTKNMAKQHRSKFNLVGQFQGFVTKDDQIKYLKLATSEREYKVKLSKEIRHHLYLAVYPGCCLEVSGTSQKAKTGIKFKADFFRIADQSLPSETPEPSVPQPQIVKPKQKTSILVCRKSSCRKRGGDEVCQAIEANLRDRHLEDQVEVKLTGCLKQCKKGPNMVMMPDKALYSKVKSAQVAALIEEHFIDKDSPTAAEAEPVLSEN